MPSAPLVVKKGSKIRAWILLGDPRPVVAHAHPRAPVARARAHRHGAALEGGIHSLHRVDGVRDQVEHRGHELARPGLDHRRATELLDEMDAAGGEGGLPVGRAARSGHPRAGQLDRLVDQGVQVDALHPRLRRLAAEVTQPLHRVHPAAHHLLHLGDRLLGPLGTALEDALHELEVEGEGVQDVLEIVGDARRHLAQGTELLRPLERRAGGAKLGVRAAERLVLLRLADRDGGEVGERLRGGHAVVEGRDGFGGPGRGAALVGEQEHERAEEVAPAHQR